MKKIARLNSNKKQPVGFSSKPKHILPKLEDYPENGLLMAFTINPKEQWFMIPDRYVRVKAHVVALLESYNAKYELYAEVSPESRIHWHGYVKIYDYFKWVLNDLPQILDEATIAIKDTLGIDKNVIEWDKYCMKQQGIHALRPLHINRKNSFTDGVETKSYLSQSAKVQFYQDYPPPDNQV